MILQYIQRNLLVILIKLFAFFSLIKLFYHLFIDKMSQTPNCRLLICRGQEKSSQETAQEQLSSFYSKQSIQKNQNSMDRCKNNSVHSKEIFSFKLNNFRNYEQSDKTHTNIEKQVQNKKEARHLLENCKSSERKTIKITQSQFINSPNHFRYYCSPPTKPQISSPCYTFKKTSVMFTSPAKKQFEPKIAFTINKDKVYGSQANEIRSKKSQQTEYSSKQSDVYHRSDLRRQVFQKIQPLQYEQKIHYQENINQDLKDNIKLVEPKPSNFGNQTERTLIDSLNEEFYKTKQMTKPSQNKFQPSSIDKNNLTEQPRILSFKNHYQTLKVNSPIHQTKIKLVQPGEYSYNNIKQMKNVVCNGGESSQRQNLRQRAIIKIV